MKVEHDPHRKELERKSRRLAGSKERKAAEKTNSIFSFTQAFSATVDDAHSSIDNLIRQVDDFATQFLKEPTEAKLIQYTDVVRSFLRKAMKESYAVEKMFDRHNRLYTLVREVDEKMAKITEEIISGQWKAIELAARVKEIRGVLLDMYV